MAFPILLELLAQEARLASSRALLSPGIRIDTRRAMMAMTTNSSISVKPFLFMSQSPSPRPILHSFGAPVRSYDDCPYNRALLQCSLPVHLLAGVTSMRSPPGIHTSISNWAGKITGSASTRVYHARWQEGWEKGE